VKLLKGRQWARQTFETGSRPTDETICKWIVAEEVPGVIIDGKPYVYASRFAITPTVQKASSTARDLLA